MVLRQARGPRSERCRNCWYAASLGAQTVLLKYLENADFRDLFNKLSYRGKDGIPADYLADWDNLMEKSDPDEIPPEKLLYQTGYFTLRQESRSCAKLAIATDEVSESLSGLYFEISRMTHSEAVRSRLAKAGVLADSMILPEFLRFSMRFSPRERALMPVCR